MTSVARVGRNEPCPCGSGKKYKLCHGIQKRGLSNLQLLIVGAVLVVALTLAISAYRAAGNAEAPVCPPGQTWSSAHGHCH